MKTLDITIDKNNNGWVFVKVYDDDINDYIIYNYRFLYYTIKEVKEKVKILITEKYPNEKIKYNWI